MLALLFDETVQTTVLSTDCYTYVTVDESNQINVKPVKVILIGK